MLKMLLKESTTGRFGVEGGEFEEHGMESIVLWGNDSRNKPPHACYRPTWVGVVWFEAYDSMQMPLYRQQDLAVSRNLTDWKFQFTVA